YGVFATTKVEDIGRGIGYDMSEIEMRDITGARLTCCDLYMNRRRVARRLLVHYDAARSTPRGKVRCVLLRGLLEKTRLYLGRRRRWLDAGEQIDKLRYRLLLARLSAHQPNGLSGIKPRKRQARNAIL